jgi:hypothetical protein
MKGLAAVLNSRNMTLDYMSSTTSGSSAGGKHNKEYRKFKEDLEDEKKEISARKKELAKPGGARKLIEQIRQKRRNRS